MDMLKSAICLTDTSLRCLANVKKIKLMHLPPFSRGVDRS